MKNKAVGAYICNKIKKCKAKLSNKKAYIYDDGKTLKIIVDEKV